MTAIENGYIQREIMESAYRYQKEEEAGKRIVVGVNKFRSEQEVEPSVFRVDPRVEDDQKQRLRRFKEARDQERLSSVLKRVDEAARGNNNLVPILLQAVKAGATVGELCEVLRSIYGTYREVKPF